MTSANDRRGERLFVSLLQLMLVSRCFRHMRAGQFRAIHVRLLLPTFIRTDLKGFQDLRDKFKDPLSPFYLAPGEKGPESPDPAPPSSVTEQAGYESAAVKARQELSQLGYDPTTFYEQRVVWGDHDSFQYVLRFSLRGLLTSNFRILSDT